MKENKYLELQSKCAILEEKVKILERKKAILEEVLDIVSWNLAFEYSHYKGRICPVKNEYCVSICDGCLKAHLVKTAKKIMERDSKNGKNIGQNN